MPRILYKLHIPLLAEHVSLPSLQRSRRDTLLSCSYRLTRPPFPPFSMLCWTRNLLVRVQITIRGMG
jgi:hypothetical protein